MQVCAFQDFRIRTLHARGGRKIAASIGTTSVWVPFYLRRRAHMDLASVHTLYDVLADDRFDLLYSGRFHDEHTASLIALGEDSARDSERAHRQRLSFVMVEAYQNIVRHRAALQGSLERSAGRCLFMLRSRANGDEVLAVDPVRASETPELNEVLTRVGGSDVKQLKQLFLDRLRDGSRTVRGGAGLGLIEMARRSGNGMRHALLPLDAANKLFLLQVMVGAPATEVTPVDEVMRMHTLVAANDLLLLCRRARSAAAQEAIMHMIEKDLDDGDGGSAGLKRAFLAAMEWLEVDMSERSFVALAREGDGHALVAGGCVPHETVERWRGEVERINALSPTDRERHYRNGLLGRSAATDLNTGLLDLARLSKGPLRMATFTVPDGTRLLVEAQLS